MKGVVQDVSIRVIAAFRKRGVMLDALYGIEESEPWRLPKPIVAESLRPHRPTVGRQQAGQIAVGIVTSLRFAPVNGSVVDNFEPSFRCNQISDFGGAVDREFVLCHPPRAGIVLKGI